MVEQEVLAVSVRDSANTGQSCRTWAALLAYFLTVVSNLQAQTLPLAQGGGKGASPRLAPGVR